MAQATRTKPQSSQRNMRPVHRIIGSILFLFILYFATTGTLMQLVDVRAILTNAPGTDKEVIQMHEGIDGPRNYVVIVPTDYAATPLPSGLDYNAALAKVLLGAQGVRADMRYVELRMIAGKPTGIVRTADRTFRFDAATGAALPAPIPTPPAAPENSLHLKFKILHTLREVGGFTQVINVLTAAGLFVLVVTGLVLYFRLLRTRYNAGLKSYFWSAGGTWRSLHRGVSIVSAIFVLVISASGTMLSMESVGVRVYRMTHKNAGRYAQFPSGVIDDYSSPLPADKLPAMLQTSLTAIRASGTSPIKAIRLRYFAGSPQGVVIAGSEAKTAQLIYNSETGKKMSLTEAGYPKTHYFLGWRLHELTKQIHRGDFFGLPGRLMDLFAGFSLIFLSISGAWMYFDLWRRRRKAGRPALFWT